METWKPIEGYNGLYEVSNFGNVRSVDRECNTNIRHVNTRIIKGRLLKQNLKRNGYLTVDLCKDSKIKTTLVHRLVANAFIPNPHGLRFVNHKDSDRQNNKAKNLEWVTSSENRKHGIEHGKVKFAAKPIRCVEARKVFERPTLAAEWVKKIHPERINGTLRVAAHNIAACCKGEKHKAYGYTWTYYEGSTTIPKGSTPKRAEMGGILPGKAGD